MAQLRAVLDSLDDVDEALHALYVEQDGKFVLDADVESHPGVGALKRALERERENLSNLKAERPEGFSKERWDELQQLAQEVSMGKLTDKQREEVENLKKQLKDQNAKEIGKLGERIKTLETALRKELITARATAAISEAKGSVKLLLPHVEQRASVVEQDGEFVPVVVDEKGHRRIGENSDNMTFAELVAEMRASKDFAGAFEGTGSSGGGAPRSAAGSGTPSSTGRPKVVPAGDPKAFIDNLEEIATGKAEVR